MTQQPEALRLADMMQASNLGHPSRVAAELRRLHAENERLREAINKFITEELTVGQRYTNAGQCLLDALARAGEKT